MNPISVSTMAYHGHGDESAFRDLADLGVCWVEPAYIARYRPRAADDGFFSPGRGRALDRALRSYGLRCLAVSAHTDLGADHAAQAVARRLEFCAAAGVAVLITNAGARARKQPVWRTLDLLLPRAESLGVTVALENPGDPGDSLLGSGAEAGALLKRFDSPCLALNYDCSNVFSYSRGAVLPEADFGAAVPHLTHLHLKDLARLPRRRWRFTAIGRGITDYRSILTRAAAAAPAAPIGLELPLRFHRGPDWSMRLAPRREPLPLDDIRAAVLRSMQFVRETIEAAPRGAPGDARQP